MRTSLFILMFVVVSLPLLAEPHSPALDRLIKDAEAALKVAPVSVMEKQEIPPSGDKHDYLSLAIYWWPNPRTEDGLPWIRKDGKRNPGVDAIPDKPNKNVMSRTVEICALAWRHTGDEKYADHAADHLRTWFIDPETRMNPNLAYAQGIPGISNGRCWGIIDTAHLGEIGDWATLLVDSESWTVEDHEALKAWFAAYLKWMRESVPGKAEGLTKNNHGTWYDAQVVHYALFAGDYDYARKVCEAAGKKRIAPQIRPDGSQPHELSRTKSWDYSIYNLQAYFRLALLAERLDVDLWNWESADGSSIRGALDFLVPYASRPDEWPHRQIKDIHFGGLAELLHVAAGKYDAPEYYDLASKLIDLENDSSRRQLKPAPGYCMTTNTYGEDK